MDEQKNINAAALRNLELLNKQVAELLQVQRKAVSGYDYLNANELADLLGESIKTIYARVHNRQIPFYKPGGKILLFKLDEIREWINPVAMRLWMNCVRTCNWSYSTKSMKKAQKLREEKDGKQIVRLSLVKLFMNKRTHVQSVPEHKFCRFLNLTK